MGYVDKGREPSLRISSLGSLYENVGIFSYPLVRIAAGAFLLAHGWPKLMSGTAGLVTYLTRLGFEPAIFWAWFMIALENLGGICIILGLFTRPIAALLVIYFAVIIYMVHWSIGFAWNLPRGGWEFPAFWGLVWIAILLRGGGPYSLDRRLGREF